VVAALPEGVAMEAIVGSTPVRRSVEKRQRPPAVRAM